MPSSDAAATRLAIVGARAGKRRSAVPVQDSAALASVGFEVLSEVVGAVSVVDTRGGFYSDGWTAAELTAPRTYTSSPPNHRVGVPASLTTKKVALARALDRLRAEARALDADGVVAVRTEVSRSAAQSGSVTVGARNVVAHGVAVRARRRRRSPSAPFTTSMTGTQVATALRGGLVPVTFLQVPVMAIRWVDPNSAQARLRLAPSGEIDAYTDIVTVCRQQARDDFARAAAQAGADATVIDSMTLALHGVQPSYGGECTAEVVITGTALATFTPPRAQPKPLLAVPLSGRP